MLLFTPYTYTHGIANNVYLPLNGDTANFEAYFTGLSGLPGISLPDCYDKYGISWKWNQFTCSVPPFSAITLSAYQPLYPKTWNDTKCTFPGLFPKKWKCEGADWSIPFLPIGSWGTTAPHSAFLFSPNPLPAVASSILWVLSSEQWLSQNIIAIHPDVSQKFPYSLKFFNTGGIYGTTSYLEDTVITLNAQVSVLEIDTRTCPPTPNPVFITYTQQITAHSPPVIDVYTPNRYVLSGSLVEFENLTTKLHFVSAFYIDFDDGITKFITDVNSNFTASYFHLGTKTLNITAYTYHWPEPIVASFPDIITVVRQYDDVAPENYRSILDALNLPWKTTPRVEINDWAIADNINYAIKQFFDNLNYLENYGKYYTYEFLEFFGYFGPLPDPYNLMSSLLSYWLWSDLDGSLSAKAITWKDLYWSGDPLDTMPLSAVAKWQNHEVASLGLDICDDVSWNTNIINKIDPTWIFSENIFDRKHDQFRNVSIRPSCIYKGVFSKNNILYINTDKSVKVVNKDKNFSYYSSLSSFDGLIELENVVSVSVDSKNRIFILDADLLQIGVYSLTTNLQGERIWSLITSWGGLGKSNNKFLNPVQLYLDHLDRVWIVDKENESVKHFINTGSWLKSIKDIKNLISISQDSQNNMHILTDTKVLVYSYDGQFLFDYEFSMADSSVPRKISSTYNKEILYITFENQVAKFFRNGTFAGLPIKETDNITNINGVFQDEYRNVLILSEDKILKFIDLMERNNSKGILSSQDFWKPEDVYIHREEFIQNWVYNKTFSKIWDNIEMFKNTAYYLTFSRIPSLSCSDVEGSCEFFNSECKRYLPPKHKKDEIFIGQNEIVTSVVINRVLKHLWENFERVLPFFQKTCMPL